MEESENKSRNTDEVDLAQFFRWIGRGFKRLGNSILYSIATLRNLFFQNRLFFAGIIVLGLILGALYSELLKKDYFKSSMVLSCDYLNNQILMNTFENLNLLAGEEDKNGLAVELGIDIEIAEKIQEFQVEPFLSEEDMVETEVLREQLSNVPDVNADMVEQLVERMRTMNRKSYRIDVAVFDPAIVKPLEKAIVAYFRDNDYVRRRIEITGTNLKIRKAKLESESRKLDSLKAVLFQNYQMMGKTSRGSNNVILGDEKLANPLDVFTQDLALHAEILDIDRQLYISPDFEVVEGFTTFRQPANLTTFQILIIAFFISWLMGYLIIAAWSFDKVLAEVPTKKIVVRKH